MTQVADIITDAYRETNLIAVNANPSPLETTEALRRLQSLVLSTLGNDVGYIMEDWNLGAQIVRPNGVPLASALNFVTPPNARLIFQSPAPMTIKLDPQPQDGARFSVVDATGNMAASALTVDPNGRKINGAIAPAVLQTNGLSRQWFYRSDLADWVLIDPLVVTSEMPFPSDFDDFFIIMLAMRLNPRNGIQIAEASAARLSQQRTQFAARYSQSRLRSIPAPIASNPARVQEG